MLTIYKKMLPAVIIFARMSSRRLPGKMLKKIGNKTLLDHIIGRAKKIKLKSAIILATSKSKSDDGLVNVAKKAKIEIFRGNLKNVTKRAYDCCSKFNIKSFVRVCGDRIFLDYKDIDKSIKLYLKRNCRADLASNLFMGKIPPGKTIEIINIKVLKKILLKTKNKRYLEHVTTYIYENKKKFNVLKLQKPKYCKNVSFSYSVDNKEDYQRSNFIAEKSKNFKNITNLQILSLTKKWYEQKYLLKK